MLPSRSCALIVTAFRLRTTFGASPLGMGRNRAAGGVWHATASMVGRLRTGCWSYMTVRIPEKQKVVRARAAPQGTCENLINTLKLLTKPAEGWRQSSGNKCHRFVGVKSQQDHGRAREVLFFSFLKVSTKQ